MNKITRQDAIDKLEEFYSEQRVKIDKRLQGLLVMDWGRYRNYELEWKIRQLWGEEDWVIVTRCPFNGIFCNAMEYIDEAELRDTIDTFETAKKTREYGEYLDYDYHIRLLRKELERRGVEDA
jgi:hypothetical protein